MMMMMSLMMMMMQNPEQSLQLGSTTAMDAMTPQSQKIAAACRFGGLLLLALAFALLGEELGTNMIS